MVDAPVDEPFLGWVSLLDSLEMACLFFEKHQHGMNGHRRVRR